MDIEELERLAEQEEVGVYDMSDACGETVPVFVKDGKEYPLCSIYDREGFAKLWTTQQDFSNYRTIVVLFGMADGTYIRALKKLNKDITILVFEPSYSMVYLHREVLADEMLMDGKTIIIAGMENTLHLKIWLEKYITYSNRGALRIAISPNYEMVFSDEFDEIHDIVTKIHDKKEVEKTTIEIMGGYMQTNSIKNMPAMIDGYSSVSLIEKFAVVDKDRVPAIVVASGPSLDKNIKYLQRAKGKAFIIATDTAFNPLAAAGILPDMAVTVDPKIRTGPFENEKVREIPLLCSLTYNHRIDSVQKGMRIFAASADTQMDVFLKRYGKTLPEPETGGSVANDCYSMARLMGFKTIIFIGQDLAYPGGQGHAEGALKPGKDSMTHKELFDVEDIYGNMVPTEYNMNMYRLWYENQVQLHPEVRCIDATEGGAKIHGMEIMTLNQAIDETCLLEEPMDFEALVRSTEKLFTPSQREEVVAELADFHREQAEIRAELKRHLAAYDRLDEFNRRHKYSGKEFERVMEAVARANEYPEKISYLMLYTAKDEYEVGDVILEEKKNTYDEIKFIIENGRRMLGSYVEASKKYEKDMEEIDWEGLKAGS